MSCGLNSPALPAALPQWYNSCDPVGGGLWSIPDQEVLKDSKDQKVRVCLWTVRDRRLIASSAPKRFWRSCLPCLEPRFLHLFHGDNNSTDTTGVVVKINVHKSRDL